MSTPDSHGGRELELLLNGTKPLAAFSYYIGANEVDCFSGQDFAGAVEDGQLLRYEKSMQLDEKPVLFVAFTTPSESWRAHAYFHLIEFMYTQSWCAHLEWIEGSLLGHTDSQNRAHIMRKYGKDGPVSSCKHGLVR